MSKELTKKDIMSAKDILNAHSKSAHNSSMVYYKGVWWKWEELAEAVDKIDEGRED